jgi:hypothetical protein
MSISFLRTKVLLTIELGEPISKGDQELGRYDARIPHDPMAIAPRTR